MSCFQVRIASALCMCGFLLGSEAPATAAILADLQAHYRFDDGTGSIAADSAGTAQNGSLLNFPTDDSQWVPGLFGSALNMDGVDDEVSASVNVSETTYAVSFWINTSTPGGGMIEGNRQGGHDRHVYMTSNGNVAARVWNNQTITSTGIDVADGDWHHIVHTHGAGVEYTAGMFGGQALYVDGIRVAGGNKVTSDFNPSNPVVRMGFSMDGPTDNFQGVMDDAGFLQQELDAIEVGAISSLGRSAVTNYDLQEVGQLLDAFNTSTPSLTIDGLKWLLVDDGSLTGAPGQLDSRLVSGFPVFSIALDASGNGFATPIVPEPSTGALMLLGLAALARRKRKK